MGGGWFGVGLGVGLPWSKRGFVPVSVILLTTFFNIT